MSDGDMIMTLAERTGWALCALYRRYGYMQYRMSKFEEYDLYGSNKDFLVSDAILTFTDLSGRLMALKPDVTLSIVRSSRDDLPGVQKVCYRENVYRASAGRDAFREILQAGLECIGPIDDYDVAEVLLLAAGSLRLISARSVLLLSHLDLVSAQLDRLGLPAAARQRALRFIAEKNLHDLAALCAANGADAAGLCRLLKTEGAPDEVLPRLAALGCDPAAVAQLRTLCGVLAANGLGDLVRLDFSVLNDTNYYNGVVFRGFVEGLPAGVVSGGQYDRLMARMGRRSRAIGFAVYLDALERMEDAPDDGEDMVLLYDEGADPAALSRAVKALTEKGVRVSAQRCAPAKRDYRTLARWNGSEVESLDEHA
jgi:ATP phosphoribosyltransferase regulatory subunit